MTLAFCVTQLTKRHPSFELGPVELALPEGEIMGLVGVNGAGKTTLLRLLAGITAPDSGSVEVLGFRLPDAQVSARRGVAFASEDMRLYASRDLAWHINFVRKLVPQWDVDYAESLLRRFDLRTDQPVGGLSHGQRVKALLLLCLARQPKLLLLDEPTTGLDPVARVEVLEALADVLRDDRRSVLFSSHQTHDVEQLSDRITMLDSGRVVASATKDAFIDSWRRVICHGIRIDTVAKAWPEVVQARQSGSQCELKIRDWSDEIRIRLSTEGFEVVRVDSMSLEEIFVTSVRARSA